MTGKKEIDVCNTLFIEYKWLEKCMWEVSYLQKSGNVAAEVVAMLALCFNLSGV